jgi:SMC interacting uncharacterized protein involved in chromosome segregation
LKRAVARARAKSGAELSTQLRSSLLSIPVVESTSVKFREAHNMVDTKEIKESLQREVEALTKARDELKLQLALAKSEAKDEWTRLESSFERLQGEIKRIGIDAREPLKDIGLAVQNLVDGLKKGVSRVKTEVKADIKDATD